MRYPESLEKLMRLVQKLPGVGRRTAERYAFDFLLTWKEEELQHPASIRLLSRARPGFRPQIRPGIPFRQERRDPGSGRADAQEQILIRIQI